MKKLFIILLAVMAVGTVSAQPGSDAYKKENFRHMEKRQGWNDDRFGRGNQAYHEKDQRFRDHDFCREPARHQPVAVYAPAGRGFNRNGPYKGEQRVVVSSKPSFGTGIVAGAIAGVILGAIIAH